MLQKPAPDATGDVDYRLLVPVLVNSTLIHTVVSILRVTTSYRAVELELPIVWLGVISATFAIFPIFLAVWVGRFIDRGNDAVTVWIGSGLVAAAVGQGLGPFVVGWAGGAATLPPTGRLFTIALIGAAVTFLIALTIRPARTLPHYIETKDVMPVTALLRRPGVAAVIACGVFIVTAQDLVVIYLPILGAERAIDVNVIGVLLTVRAALSMVSRVIYARMVMEFGRDPLMVTCTFVAALAFVSLACPIPLWAMYLAMAVMGFTLGLATTLSVTTVVDRTPASA